MASEPKNNSNLGLDVACRSKLSVQRKYVCKHVQRIGNAGRRRAGCIARGVATAVLWRKTRWPFVSTQSLLSRPLATRRVARRLQLRHGPLQHCPIPAVEPPPEGAGFRVASYRPEVDNVEMKKMNPVVIRSADPLRGRACQNKQL